MKKMSKTGRIIIAVSSLALISVYFLPVWFIYLIAPQYPEGLTMNIWLYQITGQVEIINGLNHYIGMKHIKAEMFPEFGYLVYILGFYILFGLVIAATGSRKLLFGFLIATLFGAGAAMYDFYKWGYDYGHNLDPKAAIQVPGLSYQPPLLGHKTLLNFDAYSYPDTGGWVFIGVAAIFFIVWFFEWKKNRKKFNSSVVSGRRSALAAAVVTIVLTSCTAKPEPINYGKDQCDDCRMTIMDPKFGAEVVTKKGRVYKFDDLHCLLHFRKSAQVKDQDVAQTVVIDYNNPQAFLDAPSAFYVKAEALNSPMNSNTAAFATSSDAEIKAKEFGTTTISWSELTKTK